MSKVYFQIGTNDGNDLFLKKVIEDKPDLIILVEPNTNLIDTIKHYYNGIKNVYIYNNAIYYRDDELVELYIPAKNGIMGTRADNNGIYNHVHFSLLPMNDWGHKNDMVKISSISITFDKICILHNIKIIDYLQIDTEGFDYEIIKMINLSKYKINKLRFEKWTFDTHCFTKYHKEKSNQLGINGMNDAIDKLKNNNYTINEIHDDDGNDMIAILNH